MTSGRGGDDQGVRASLGTWVLRWSGLVLVHGLLALGAWYLPTHAGNIPFIWPAAGLALAATILWGPWILPAVAVGTFLTGFFGPTGAAVAAVGLAVAASVQAAIGAAWIRPARHLEGRRDLWRLGLGAAMAAGVGACLGVVVLAGTGALPLAEAPRALFVWWMADLAGIMLLTPLVLAWVLPRPGPSRDLPFWLAVSGGLGVLAAWGDSVLAAGVPVVWTALRLGLRGGTAVFVLVATVVWAAPFVGLDAVDPAVLPAATVMGAVMVLVLAVQGEALDRTRARLTASEDRLGRVIDLVPHPIYARDGAGRLVLANRAVDDLLGRPATEGDGALLPVGCEPDVRRSGKVGDDGEEGVTDGAGHYRLLDTTRGPLEDQDLVLAVSVDITERRHDALRLRRYQAELEQRLADERRALVDSEERFKALFRNTSLALILTDLDGDLHDFNQAWMAMIGHDHDALIYRPLGDFVHEADRPAVTAAWADVGAGRKTRVDLTRRFRRGDGSRIWVDMTVSALCRGDGVAEGVVAVLQDVTERHRAEERLRLTQKVVEESADCILITDADSRILEVNDSLCRVTGYDRATPAKMKSGRHGPDFYRDMWQSLQETGQWRGEIWDRRKDGEVYPKWSSISAVRDDQGRTTHYVAIFSDITPIKAAEARLQHMAHFDPLTGLANRALFEDRLHNAMARAHRRGSRVGLMYVDLDGFKQVNDTLGHKAGDELMVQAAERLLGCVRDEDTVARLGGDEFAIILNELMDTNHVKAVAVRILEALALSAQFEGREIPVTASIGISCYPDDGADGDVLLRHADQAMYHAKEAGRNRYQFFDPDMNERLVARIRLEGDLRRGLEDNQFFLHYQPKLDVAEGRVVGVEALVRWRHPEQGIVPPDQFIPLAESSGLIIPLGRFVLEEACREARRWLAAGRRDVPVAVNLSPRQFRHDGLIDDISGALAASDLPPDMLEVELTEGLVMEDTPRTLEVLNRLKAMGVCVSIDDFGTGYSSLAYLKRLPVDALKIDRSFVIDMPRDRDDMAIVAAIISMAASLRLRVVAEGVETRQQLDFLGQHRCDQFQGYLVGAPVAGDRLLEAMGRAEATLHPAGEG